MLTSTDRVTAAILIIGDEILSGRTQDTNLRDIAKYFGAHGVDVAEARVVGDIEDEIVSALNHLRERYDYVVTTGGIGPTHDDITADCVAKAFGLKLYEHPEIIAMMQSRWQGEITPARRRMSRVPPGRQPGEKPRERARPAFRSATCSCWPACPKSCAACWRISAIG